MLEHSQWLHYTFGPYQPPFEGARVKVIVFLSENGLLLGVIAFAEPDWPPQVWNTRLRTTTRPEREQEKGVRQQGNRGYTCLMTSCVLPQVQQGVHRLLLSLRLGGRGEDSLKLCRFSYCKDKNTGCFSTWSFKRKSHPSKMNQTQISSGRESWIFTNKQPSSASCVVTNVHTQSLWFQFNTKRKHAKHSTTATRTPPPPPPVIMTMRLVSAIPVSCQVGLSWPVDGAEGGGMKFFQWILWLASVRKRKMTVTTTTQNLFLNNMAGWMMGWRCQEEGCVAEASINCLACYVSIAQQCDLLSSGHFAVWRSLSTQVYLHETQVLYTAPLFYRWSGSLRTPASERNTQF